MGILACPPSLKRGGLIFYVPCVEPALYIKVGIEDQRAICVRCLLCTPSAPLFPLLRSAFRPEERPHALLEMSSAISWFLSAFGRRGCWQIRERWMREGEKGQSSSFSCSVLAGSSQTSGPSPKGHSSCWVTLWAQPLAAGCDPLPSLTLQVWAW